MKNKTLLKVSGILSYIILFIALSIFVFVANDETLPLIHILRWKYLIPVSVYAGGTLFLSYLIFILLKKIFTPVFAFIISLVVGIPGGLILMVKLYEMVS